jgi:hypothetical protein
VIVQKPRSIYLSFLSPFRWFDFMTGASDKKGAAGSSGAGDMERLRKAVQTLVQHTGPLGTCMDYIQEDVGIMTMELNRWQEECKK